MTEIKVGQLWQWTSKPAAAGMPPHQNMNLILSVSGDEVMIMLVGSETKGNGIDHMILHPGMRDIEGWIDANQYKLLHDGATQ